ncbi:MAG TPA: LLM class flavin-dependent oxidoreductase [Polyangia bacterium]|jgi:luciferase family oxidoreductase group 1
MIPFSLLDLAPITAGGDAAASFRNAAALARHAEALGYHRYWLAEHHNMPGIASAATSIVIGHVAAATSTIRVGAGGIMLPNHAPLVIAEQFGTLDALHPGRIDLGVGRAPGTDQLTARALRRTLTGDVDSFPDDVQELMSYFDADQSGRRVRAVPAAGAAIEVWILGSSLFGAQLAGALGLPYAFASHFAPGYLMQAIELYRHAFRPSARLAKPHVMLGVNVVAAGSDDEARLLLTSLQQAFVNLRSGHPTPLPPPVEGFADTLTPPQAAMLDDVLACAAVGSPERVRDRLEALVARTSADELILTSQIYDHGARCRSFEIATSTRAFLRRS